MSKARGKAALLMMVLLLSCGLWIVIVRSEESPSPPVHGPKPAAAQPLPPKAAAAPDNGTVVKENPARMWSNEPDNEVIAVAPPPFSPGMFPCSGCHEDLEPNPNQRKLTRRHKEIVLQHDEKNRWCLDCHTLGNIDKLHLASGKLIDFTESYKLCGQCHGPTLRAWEAGEHGKRTGMWNGQKQYLLCAHCHNPHSPHFKPLPPLPPPTRPENLRK